MPPRELAGTELEVPVEQILAKKQLKQLFPNGWYGVRMCWKVMGKGEKTKWMVQWAISNGQSQNSKHFPVWINKQIKGGVENSANENTEKESDAESMTSGVGGGGRTTRLRIASLIWKKIWSWGLRQAMISPQMAWGGLCSLRALWLMNTRRGGSTGLTSGGRWGMPVWLLPT
mmetsp:Transcript_31593/g.77452  ORF Transcript_31593/g.77452 Transcript_31593/m.77452 type:complete len:173 (-) Transcript_31593:803-1321(-)